MQEQCFKQLLFYICESLIKRQEKNTYLAQLEIFKFAYNSIKNNKESADFLNKKNEEFKELLNFVLNILTELNLVREKMENKSYYFKWNSIIGFIEKYKEFLNDTNEFEMTESTEQRIQVYVRYFLLHLIKNKEKGINNLYLEKYKNKCGLISMNGTIENIHFILEQLKFIKKTDVQAKNIFTTSNPPITNSLDEGGKEKLYEIDNNLYETLINHEEVLNKKNIYIQDFDVNLTCEADLLCTGNNNEMMIEENKNILKSKNIDDNSNKDNTNLNANIVKNNNGNNDNNDNANNSNRNNKGNYSENLQNKKPLIYTPAYDIYSKKLDVGYAMLRTAKWGYYIKKLYCIIGRKPAKNGKINKQSNTYWEVDVDLGYGKNISKQHALIAYNFDMGYFEVKNLSKKYPIKVNNIQLNFKDEMQLSNNSIINIGGNDIYFLLPD